MTDGALFSMPTSSTPVRDAYARAVDELRQRGLLQVEHEGLAANLLKLGAIIDTERKGYAVAHATGQAHDLMKTLLALIPATTEDGFEDLMRQLAATMPSPPPPTS